MGECVRGDGLCRCVCERFSLLNREKDNRENSSKEEPGTAQYLSVTAAKLRNYKVLRNVCFWKIRAIYMNSIYELI